MYLSEIQLYVRYGQKLKAKEKSREKTVKYWNWLNGQIKELEKTRLLLERLKGELNG